MVNIKTADQNMYSSAQRAFLLRLFLDYIMGTEPRTAPKTEILPSSTLVTSGGCVFTLTFILATVIPGLSL